jgi:arginine decarboxylase
VAKTKDLSRHDANSFIADYVAGLEGYTYLEGDIPREAEIAGES